ncbi:pyruvate kinase 1, cytosolic-like [Zingiber officinale]|uniref:Pyruvate kinase n=1 Tax=Zingiber officinale TaxID=94328 RepID=A0A8J5KPG8_ZINOF|nr:pyruvate kinase 1, cytosolic-like [Zingiber officinale]XP_042428328.1 pyruvate kinase 1, cytosolic-like [Zingiber officinale]KAG6486079.1 hypothetical protein ZIOFF_054649 [Zingiber officinale]
MHTGQMLLEEPVRLASVLAPPKIKFFPSLTKIVGTLGPRSRSVETLEACLKAGMSVARFDFSGSNAEYHQETLDNLRIAVSNIKKPCAVMLDTVGPELQVCNTSGEPIELKSGNNVTLTPDGSRVPSAEVLPINISDLAKAVKKGDTVFIGQYLFTGSESTSVWLEVVDTVGDDVNCLVKNSATLAGSIFTMHVSQVSINLPTLGSRDKQVISSWALQNNVDIISLSYTRHAEDVRELREFLRSQNLHYTQIYAKIENFEGFEHFDEILQEADGIILSRGNLGIDLPPEKVFIYQKTAVKKCNMAGKPAIITRVVDSMVDNLRPTRAEATDVANAVLDGTDGILLGAETLRGLYPVETIRTVGQICSEAESVYNQAHQFKKIIQYVGEPMSHEESVASSAVRAAVKVKASVIIAFTTTGTAPRLVAKYRPPMPVLALVFPQEKIDSLNSNALSTIKARQCQALRGIYPILAISSSGEINLKEEVALKLALDYGRSVGILKPYDRAVIFEKIGDSAVVKIVEFEDS